MSVKKMDYLLVGLDLPLELLRKVEDTQDAEDHFNNTQVGQITYIYDGMNGEYFIIGVLLAYDKDGEEGIPKTVLPMDDPRVNQYSQILLKHCEQLQFEENIELVPSIIGLTHWS